MKKYLFGGEANSVFKGMATLAFGSGVARIVSIVSIPILARIYSPQDYGILSIYVALVTILAPIMTLRYVQAIPLPGTDGMAANLFAMSVCLLVMMVLALSLASWLFGSMLLQGMSMGELAPWRWLVVLGVFGAALYEALTMWATRKKAYRIIAKTQVAQSLSGECIKLLLGLLGVKPAGLLLGQFAAQSSGIGSYISRFWHDIKIQRKKISFRRMKWIARYYADYPIFRLPSQTLLTFSAQAPLLLTAAYYDVHTAGQLGLAFMALALPVSLLGDSMSKAYYAEISGIGRKRPDLVRRLSYAVMLRLFLLSIMPAVVLLVWGEWIFAKALGIQWSDAGKFASVLSIYLVFQFIQKPVSYLMFLFDGQKELLYLNLQRAAITVSSFTIGKWFQFEVLATVAIYAFLLSVHYAFSTLLAIKKIP